MQVAVSVRSPGEASAELVAVAVREFDADGGSLPARLVALDRKLGGAIRAAVASGDFRGASDQQALVYPVGTGDARGVPARVLLLGLGSSAPTLAALRTLAGRAVRRSATLGARRIALCVQQQRSPKAQEMAQALAEGAILAGYRFDAYRSKRAGDPKAAVEKIELCFDRLSEPRAARAGARSGLVLAQSQNLARDISNEPPNELPPVAMAAAARRVAREVGLKCTVLDVPAMKKLEMGAILAVGQGSKNPPRMIVLEHNAPKRGARKRPTLCVIGKGITFDSGGISLKPSANMHEMKHDMSGAATVIGAMRAVALLKLPLHIVGVIASAENLPGGNAYRPGDIVRAMSGKTIEIQNTDAEGRVVLADALHYASTRFQPQAMIDLATLTGACMVALGPWATGLFTRDEGLCADLLRAGEMTGERLWRMPLFEEHEKAMHSSVADLKNAGAREAGASTAAGFLAAFAGEAPWAHLDIAGTGWTGKNTPTQTGGATGVGVRLVVEWLRNWRAAKRPRSN